LKLVHFAPAVFTLATMVLILLSIFGTPFFLLVNGFHIFLILLDSTIRNKCIRIGLLSIITSYVQLFGYGIGFLTAAYKRVLMGKEEFTAFNRTFYK
jgi:hypothetical protein